ncbi:leucine-rich repeat-containing protein 4C-like [Folsomia candida]|uniref:leucine-rich repeat-containing protein 4C-like n=1 Tax=Folsomia candida TaxID=158441 RepID=UPI0016051A00|nr:leucine-rich repeat-containing protein 4C-like [Folsomia candida]
MWEVTKTANKLNLEGNPIKNLAFPIYFMDEVNLRNCALDKIPPNGPFVDTSLKSINLDSNNLTTLSWTEFRVARSLTKLSLKDNPWRCDCHMQFLREFLRNVKDIDISKDVVCDSPQELKGRGLGSISRWQVLPCPLRHGGLIGVATEDKITLQCLTQGVPEPVIKWYQGTVDKDNLLESQPGISIYKVPLPNSETGQLYRYEWESKLEILSNSSLYERPWTFWCTAENQYGNVTQQVTLPRPDVTDARVIEPPRPVYVHTTPAQIEIVSETEVPTTPAAFPPILPNSKNVSSFHVTEKIQSPPSIMTSNILQEVKTTPFDDSYFRQVSLVICITVVICLLFLVVLILLVIRFMGKVQHLIDDNQTSRASRNYPDSIDLPRRVPMPPPSYRSRMGESTYENSYATATYFKKY